MLRLWIFWVEILGFALFAVWQLWVRSPEAHAAPYQSANFIIYGLALIYGAFGFVSFVRRRLSKPAGSRTRT